MEKPIRFVANGKRRARESAPRGNHVGWQEANQTISGEEIRGASSMAVGEKVRQTGETQRNIKSREHLWKQRGEPDRR